MQTSYDYTQPEAVLGLVTEDFTKYVDTVVPQTAVKIGKLLTADKTAGKVRNAAKLPAAAADITKPGAMGVTFLDSTRESGSDYPANRPIGVIRRGRLWVLAESNVARWTHPFIRYAAGAGGTELGSFRADVDTASAAQLTHAIFLTDASAGQLVLVEIELF
jgi:hypothetical protein